MIEQRSRLEWIDGLRGVAAILVAILHLWLLIRSNVTVINPSLSKGISFFVSDFFDFGKIGVVVFFLISGYVIPFSLYKANAKSFLISRFFRLYPAYWLCILSFCLISGFSGVKNILINLTMLQKFVGSEDLVGVFWTLQIELIFYFICLILHEFNLLNNDKFLIKFFYSLLFISLFVAGLRYKFHLKLPVALILGLAVMFLGMLWRKNVLDKSSYITNETFKKLIIYFIVILVPLTLLAYSENFGNNEVWYRYFASYLIALLLFKLFSLYKSPGIFLKYLGTISYSMYLLHPVFGMELPVKIFPKEYFATHMLLFVLFFWVFTLIAASACYYLIEKPSISIGKRLIGKKIMSKKTTII
ncbi:acyltransferase [Mucilaginibacter gossypii]|uniref:acyltransferase family protein n=1 Tax=Mucilaginibacter gossypii TaxID=551996 RepID=UPI000DCF5060|nr:MULTISPECIES: acyltransferase [Mucilaginibacter]QTE39018.1 acyltransferase [Mucilaginibacter gossypii]RAV53438.1 hypothetical protein DIU36_23470 [Mucilaginibacter rubeus]